MRLSLAVVGCAALGPYATIHHQVGLTRFHELEPQTMLSSDSSVARCGVQCGGRALLTAQQMSEATLEAARGGGKGIVPFPAIGTNTLVLSDSLVLDLAPTPPAPPVSNIRMACDRPPNAYPVATIVAHNHFQRESLFPAAPSQNPAQSSSPTSSLAQAMAPTPAPAPVRLASLPRLHQPQPKLKLAFRVADSHSPWGSQVMGVEVRAYLHRWRGRGARRSGTRIGPHESHELVVSPRGGGGRGSDGCRLSLWTPVTVEHTVDENSPLRTALIGDWPEARGNDTDLRADDTDLMQNYEEGDTLECGGGNRDGGSNGGGVVDGGGGERSYLLQEDTNRSTRSHRTRSSGRGDVATPPPAQLQLASDAEIMVVLEGTLHSTGLPCVRRRCYRARDVRFGHAFANIVSPPSRRALWSEPQVDFDHFHTTAPTSTQ